MAEQVSVENRHARLLRSIAAGDRSALGELYEETASGLFAFALRTLGDVQDAEEVVQDVFVQVWSKAHTFDPAIGVPMYWVISITRNKCIDRLRSRQRRTRLLAEPESLWRP